jgi:purine-binding chemotaxis protein CheW
MSTLAPGSGYGGLRHDAGLARAEFLGFTIQNETYAVPIGSVVEILRQPNVTPVPRAGRHVEGVLSLRGRLVTVVSTRSLLGLARAPAERKSRILLSNINAETVGFVVDAVLQVFHLAPEMFEPPEVLSDDPPAHWLGIARVGSAVLTLIDLARLLRPATELAEG